VSYERFHAPELLLKPNLHSECASAQGLVDIVMSSVNSYAGQWQCTVEECSEWLKPFVQNIILEGAVCEIKGLRERLQVNTHAITTYCCNYTITVLFTCDHHTASGGVSASAVVAHYKQQQYVNCQHVCALVDLVLVFCGRFYC
jgi:Actin